MVLMEAINLKSNHNRTIFQEASDWSAVWHPTLSNKQNYEDVHEHEFYAIMPENLLLLLREGFKVRKKKKCGIFHTRGGVSPRSFFHTFF